MTIECSQSVHSIVGKEKGIVTSKKQEDDTFFVFLPFKRGTTGFCIFSAQPTESVRRYRRK